MNLYKGGRDIQNNNDEFEKMKNEYKNTIQTLIEKGFIENAKYLLEEYERIVKDDIEIYSIKGVLSILEGDLERAQQILEEGLKLEPLNYDLLYNLAYISEKKDMYITAYRYYKKIVNLDNNKNINIIIDKLKELENRPQVKEYKKRKKVLIIAYIFPPLGGSGVQRSLKFVKYLREFGWEPVVVTVTKSGYPLKDESMILEIPDEIEVIRIDEKKFIDLEYANKLIRIYSEVTNNYNLINQYVQILNENLKLLNKLLFIPDSQIIWASEVIDKIDEKVNFSDIDMIYTTSGPYSDHIIGYYLKKKYNKPWVADFRDEWTNNPYFSPNKEDLFYKINYEMEKNIVKFADQIITVTPISSDNYNKIFNVEKSKINTITNGYDEADFLNIPNKNKNDKFTIIHNGLLYSIRAPSTIMRALKNLIDSKKIHKSKIQLLFGWTENQEEWGKYRDSLGLKDNIKFLGYMPHKTSLIESSKGDALLLIVGPGEKNKSVYTGKIFEYLRLCKPIIALSPKGSLVEKLLEETNRGENVDFDDIKGIEEAIFKMYKEWEKNSSQELKVTEDILKYERKNLTKALSEIFFHILESDK